MYNVIFDDDENEVEIIEQDTIVQTEPAPGGSTIKDQLNKIGVELKEVGKQLKDEVSVAVTDIKKEFEETPSEPKEEASEKKEEILTTEPEDEEETLKPLDNPPDTSNGMKKL